MRKSVCTVLLGVVAVGVGLWVLDRPLDEGRAPGVSDDAELEDAARELAGGEKESDVESLGSVETPLVGDAFEVALVEEPVVASVVNAREVFRAALERHHSHKKREWLGVLSPGLADMAGAVDAGEAGAIEIRLPDGSTARLHDIRTEAFGTRDGVLTAKIRGDLFGEVVLSYVNEAVAGSIKSFADEATWEIRNAGQGRQYFALVDVDELGECERCRLLREGGGAE